MKRHNNNRILAFSDFHLPYHHKDALHFLRELKKEFEPDRVVCTGDIMDGYNASRYLKDPDHPDSAYAEFLKAREIFQELVEIFPDLLVCVGNHDERIMRAAKTAGINSKWLKSFHQVFDLPKTWVFREEHRLTVDSTRKHIVFTHNRGANVLLNSQRAGQNFVQGHHHNKASIQFWSNGRESFWGLQMPTLISNEGCPFSYSKLADINPIRGAAMIIEGEPLIIRMPKEVKK